MSDGEDVIDADSDTRFTDWIGVGLLTRQVNRDLVDDVLAETGKTEQRVRSLPSRVVVYFALGLCLFYRDPYEEVIRKLIGGLRELGYWRNNWVIPTKSALTRARDRVGVEPLKELFRRIAGPVARRSTRGAWLGSFRLVAVDGFVVNVPDTRLNDEKFGRPRKGRDNAPYPQARVVVLSECGSRAVIAAEVGGCNQSEISLAEYVIASCEPGMLLTADRNFFSFALWQAASATGADLLWRVKKNLTLAPVKHLPDGSYLAILADQSERTRATRASEITGRSVAPEGTRVRVIEYEVTNRDNNGDTELICLVTTILDPIQATAARLAAAYHERWEIETAIRDYKVTILAGRKVLRSQKPKLVEQEIWAGLIVQYSISAFRVEAAEDIDEDPDRISFSNTLRIMRRQVSLADFSPSETPPRGH